MNFSLHHIRELNSCPANAELEICIAHKAINSIPVQVMHIIVEYLLYIQVQGECLTFERHSNV